MPYSKLIKRYAAIALGKSKKNMKTPLYPTFKKRIGDSIDQLIKQQVTPWYFMPLGKPFQISKFDGGQISYEGIKFSGSARNVFWSRYIEPFIEDLCLTEIDAAVRMSQEKDVDARLALPEVQKLLSHGIERIFRKMADVDHRLRGEGFPERVSPRSVEEEVAGMNGFLNEHIQAELKMWKPKSCFEKFYERNKFLVWLISMVFSFILGLLARMG